MLGDTGKETLNIVLFRVCGKQVVQYDFVLYHTGPCVRFEAVSGDHGEMQGLSGFRGRSEQLPVFLHLIAAVDALKLRMCNRRFLPADGADFAAEFWKNTRKWLVIKKLVVYLQPAKNARELLVH